MLCAVDFRTERRIFKKRILLIFLDFNCEARDRRESLIFEVLRVWGNKVSRMFFVIRFQVHDRK